MEKRQIRADIDISTYAAINQPLADFKADLDGLAKSIGADDETANILIEYEDDCYDSGGYINAYVWRYETDEECAARERQEAEEAVRRRIDLQMQQEARDRLTYEMLKAKYEG